MPELVLLVKFRDNIFDNISIMCSSTDSAEYLIFPHFLDKYYFQGNWKLWG